MRFDPKVASQRALTALVNYRNPVALGLQRLTRRPLVEVSDRETGLTFRCKRGSDRMFGETFHQRLYDVPMVPVGSGDVVVDIGANHGFVSGYFAARGARVFAFEPDPEVFVLLQGNLDRNDLASRVVARQWAIADHDGRTAFFATDTLGGGQSSTEAKFVSDLAVPVASAMEVECRTLKTACDGLGISRIRLLKIDCEGAELGILRTLDSAFLDRVDSIALEYHPAPYQLSTLVDLLLGWGNFHLSKAAATRVENANLNLVNVRCIRAWAAGQAA
jgi:FkbM family methyltransferase